MNIVNVVKGDGLIVLAQPHGGTFIPDDLLARLNPLGQARADTDWHITQLYDDLLPSATTVRSNVHRYVIDANRDPMDASLYPGQNTTTLCPLTTFDGDEIWHKGQAPSEDEIAQRRAQFHAPYHSALATELERVRAKHGVSVLYDCHSIRSDIPYLFDGTLPVFSIGTHSGAACDAQIEQAVHRICRTTTTYDTVLNGRFKGGWTTRHYGQPKTGVHAIQMELAQRAYMNETPPWGYRTERAMILRPILSDILKTLDTLARSGALTS